MDMNFLYNKYHPICVEIMRRRMDSLGRDFCTRYNSFINTRQGAQALVNGIEARLNRIVPPNTATTNQHVAEACAWILSDASAKYRSRAAQSYDGFGGGTVGSSVDFGSDSSFTTTTAPTDVLDPDFIAAPSTQAQNAPQQQQNQPQSNTRTFTPTAPQAAQPMAVKGEGHSPYGTLTDADLSKPAFTELDMGVFERKRIQNSSFGTITAGISLSFGSAPPISLLKTSSRIPVSNPNVLEKWAREIFTTDVVGMYWAFVVQYNRLYTLPLPLENYLELVKQIKERSAEDGYTPDLVIQVLKNCSQATYEAVSKYLVDQFNKISSRFIRSTKNPDHGISLNNLDGIPLFFKNPPMCAPTENPLGITEFSVITNTFFRNMFSTESSPVNSGSLSAENYMNFMHNDELDVWDGVDEISRLGVPLLPKDKQDAWMDRINKRVTIFSRPENVVITNVASPACVTSVGIGQRLHQEHSGDSRVLHAVMRVADFSKDQPVSGLIAAPLAHNGSTVMTNFTIGNPLENPKDVCLYRAVSL